MSGVTALKEQNIKAVLSVLLRHDAVTRNMIIRESGLAASTVSMITGMLIEQGLIYSGGYMSTSGAGRKTEVLRRSPAAGYVVSVFITPEKVSVGLFDFSYTLVNSLDFEFQESFQEKDCMKLIKGVEKLTSRRAVKSNLKFIGIALPTYPFDADLVRSAFAQRFPVPVSVINNVEAIALSEYYHSLRSNYETLAYVYVGTGIGSALVIGGELYKGASGHASDIGHTYIVPEDLMCRCGRTGCLETKSSEWAMGKILERLEGAPIGSRSQIVEKLKEKIEGRDDRAMKMLKEAAQYLGRALYNLAAITDPEVICVSGRIHSLNPHFSSAVERSYISLARFNPKNNIVPLHFIPLRSDSGMDGTAINAFMTVYG